MAQGRGRPLQPVDLPAPIIVSRSHHRETTPTTPGTTYSKEDLTCTVCLDYLKEPKLLPCLHSFCKGCLEGLARKTGGKGQIVCPQCRSNHDVPRNGIGGFPSDLVATNVHAFHQHFQKPRAESAKAITCNTCTEGDPATTHCPACNRFLCDFCSKAHKRQVDYRHHKLVPLDKADTEALKVFERPQYCPQHQGEVLKLYCKTCHQLICRDCTIVDHRDHTFGFTTTLRPEVEQSIRQMSKATVAKQKEFQAHLDFIKVAERERGEHSAKLGKEINAAFDSLIMLVEQQRRKLLQQEESAKTADLKRIWGQKEFIEITLANIASGLRYVDRLCSCTNDQDMLAMSHKVKQQLSTIQKRRWAPEESFQFSNLFTFPGITTGQQLAKGVGKLRKFQVSNFTVSVRPLGFKCTPQINVELRKTLRFAVEVKTRSDGKHNHFITPSVSVTDNQTSKTLDYTHTLVYEQRSNSWLLTVALTYAGSFTLSVFVGSNPNPNPNPDQSYVRGYHQPHYGRRGYGQVHEVGYGEVYEDEELATGQQPTSTYIQVSGAPKRGDRIRRGPGWCGGDEDGGVGSEGVVVTATQPTHSAEMQRGGNVAYYGGYQQYGSQYTTYQTVVNVLWDNGKKAQYKWTEDSEEPQSFPIELVPSYLLVEK